MKEQLLTRLTELKQEFQKGQERLQQLEAEATNIRDTMLRLQGAIQVLEEELASSEPEDTNSSLNGEMENKEEIILKE